MNNKSFYTVLTLLSLGVLVSTSLVQAQSPSPTTEVTQVQEENDVEIKESIKQRIQEAVKKNNDEPTSLPQALVGKIESVTDQSLSLIINGLTELVSITPETQIIDEDQDELAVEDLEIDGGVIAILNNVGDTTYTAKQLISIEAVPEKSDKKSILSTVLKVDTRADELELATLPNLESLVFEPDRNTSITEFNSEDDLDLEDLNTGDKILAIYTLEDNEYTLISAERVSTNEASNSADIDN